MLSEYPMGRLYVPDPRDEQYPMQEALPPVKRKPHHYFTVTEILDQRAMHCPHCNDGRHYYCCRQGFCVGCAWRGFLSIHGVKADLDAIGLYHGAQMFDQWPGEAGAYAGSSVRGGAQALRKRFGGNNPIVAAFSWAQSLDAVLDALLGGISPVVVGTLWRQGMFEADENGFIAPRGRNAGGHAYLLTGANAKEEKIRITNSWGSEWGNGGHAWIAFRDMETLLFDGYGEACIAEVNPSWK